MIDKDFDWQNFDVPFDNYFNGDREHTAEEYEEIFNFVNSKCHESGEYAIDCFEDHYKVRKKSEINERIISMLTSEQKAESKRAERDVILKATDVYMLPDFPISEDQRELYKQYRQYLRDLPAMEGFPEIGVMSFKEWGQWIGD